MAGKVVTHDGSAFLRMRGLITIRTVASYTLHSIRKFSRELLGNVLFR